SRAAAGAAKRSAAQISDSKLVTVSAQSVLVMSRRMVFLLTSALRLGGHVSPVYFVVEFLIFPFLVIPNKALAECLG
ncbi:MAG: hypothetical protein VYA18_01890, partial [Pseudomonadota bacterium]|nr:hypothetical protein [Pseudomonadota bacterium]